MSVRLEAVDEDGNAFVALRPGMRFTVDDLASAEFAGDYLIDTREGMTINPPSDQEPLGSIEVGFVQYNAAAAVDVSDPPDDAYRTIASATLPNLGVSLQMSNVAWVLVATPVVVDAGGSLTVTIADLELQVLGRPTSTKYPGATWTGVPSGTVCVLYLDDPGTGATMGLQTGGMPLASPPADRYAVLAGSFTSAGAVVFGPNFAEQEVTW